MQSIARATMTGHSRYAGVTLTFSFKVAFPTLNLVVRSTEFRGYPPPSPSNLERRRDSRARSGQVRAKVVDDPPQLHQLIAPLEERDDLHCKKVMSLVV